MLGAGAAADEPGQEQARHDDPDRQDDREEERPASPALEQLAPRHEPDRSTAAHWTTSMNSSDRVGGWKAKRRTGPAADAAARVPARSTSLATRSFTRSPRRSTTVRSERPSSQSAFEPWTSTSRWRRLDAARSSSIEPAAAIRPRLMIATSSQRS